MEIVEICQVSGHTCLHIIDRVWWKSFVTNSKVSGKVLWRKVQCLGQALYIRRIRWCFAHTHRVTPSVKSVVQIKLWLNDELT